MLMKIIYYNYKTILCVCQVFFTKYNEYFTMGFNDWAQKMILSIFLLCATHNSQLIENEEGVFAERNNVAVGEFRGPG